MWESELKPFQNIYHIMLKIFQNSLQIVIIAINGIVVSKIENICHFNKKKEIINNMLNNNGPKIEPFGTP